MEFAAYKYLWILLLLIPLLIGYSKSLADRPFKLKFASFILRCLAIIFICLALCRPYIFIPSNAAHVNYLLDISDSTDSKSVREAADKIKKEIAELKWRDSYSVFIFGEHPQKIELEDLNKYVELKEKGLLDKKLKSATDISRAVLMSRLAFPAGKAKITALFSDGLDSGKDLKNALETLKKENVALAYLPIKAIKKKEAALEKLSCGNKGRKYYRGETVRLAASVAANYNGKAKLRFLNKGICLKEKEIILRKNETIIEESDFIIDDQCSPAWRAEIVPEYDYFPLNNSASCSVELKDSARALTIHNKPGDLRYFVRAMKKQNIDIERRNRLGLPDNVSDLNDFDAVILANVAASDLSNRQLSALRDYVMDLGGGLLMTGSENSFGLGGYYKTPVEEVLPVVSRYEKEKENPSLSMVLVIDKSGSMSGQPIQLARDAAVSAVELLGPRDRVGVIAFDGNARVISEMTSAANASSISEAIRRINAGGGTNLYPAMIVGKEMLSNSASKVKHMIILSDGQSMPGDFEGAADEMSGMSITVSTVALGMGSHRALMKRIAEIGKGRYYETVDSESIPRIFSKETIEASKSAIKEEPFVPVKISSEDFLGNIDFNSAPMLMGFVMTRLRPTAKAHLLTENGEPLLATGQYGLGKAAAFTSGITEKWASEWLEWKRFGPFWAQLLRHILKENNSEGISTYLESGKDSAKLRINAMDLQGNPQNDLEWEGAIFSNNGKYMDIKIKANGFGSYEAEFNPPPFSNYLIKLKDKINGKMKSVVHNSNYPKEYQLSLKSSPELEKYKKDKDSPILQSINAQKEVNAANFFACTALLCAILGILLRRL
jgi:uncharacterized membrane protein